MSRQKEAGNRDKREMWEQALCDALDQKAQSLIITSQDTERMKSCVRRRIEEEPSMRKWNAKKMIIAAAAVCVLGSITAVAAGKITMSSGYSSHNEEFTQYSQLAAKAAELGFEAKAPEAFSNGYQFTYGVPVHNKGMDEDGNVLRETDSLSVGYKKAGMADITIDIEGTAIYDEASEADQTFEYKGITLRYSSDHYRFVPPSYEVSAEEQARMDAGELYVSYGSDKVEDKVTKGIDWDDEGVRYYMLSFDNTMSSEEFYQMACEMIDMGN